MRSAVGPNKYKVEKVAEPANGEVYKKVIVVKD